MILTAHALTGAAIAKKIKKPILSVPLIFFSHFLLDAVPHAEYSLYHKWFNLFFFIDLIFGFLIIAAAVSLKKEKTDGLIFLLAGFLAILPDGLQFLGFIIKSQTIIFPNFINYFLSAIVNFSNNLHHIFHAKFSPNIFLGMAWEFLWSMTMIFLIKKRWARERPIDITA